MSYVYLKDRGPRGISKTRWVVGAFSAFDGRWLVESVHEHADSAARRAALLNLEHYDCEPLPALGVPANDPSAKPNGPKPIR